jgi:hypothetical protein
MSTPEIEPFGSPDGASEDPGSFIRFDDVGRWRDLALMDNDRRARILVGRRGSGKSRYMRTMQVSVLNEGLLNYPQRDTKIDLTNLRWIHRTFPDRAERLEVWENAWSCAIYAGVAAYLLYTRQRASNETLSAEDRYFLNHEAKSYIPDGPRAQPIVAVLNDIITNYNDRSRLTSYLKETAWYSIEGIVLDTITNETPIFCFIDALDDNYANAPAESTDAQLGLLNWILRKVVDSSVSNRLHVIVTVRDVIYSALLASDHGQRYNSRVHIKCLDWDNRSSSFYLQEKIRMLPKQFRIGSSGNNLLREWLGFDTIRNSKRGDVEEKVEDYILRHTRFLPREINEIGNSIATEIRLQKSSKRLIEPEKIRRIISLTAQNFARNMMNEVALHLAALDEISENDPNSAEYLELIQVAVTKFFSKIMSEKFSRVEIDAAHDIFKTHAPWWSASMGGHPVTIQDVIWQHGLIGYRRQGDPERWVRYFNSAAWGDGDLMARLPEAEHYYLHSALLDVFTLVTEQIAPVAHAN